MLSLIHKSYQKSYLFSFNHSKINLEFPIRFAEPSSIYHILVGVLTHTNNKTNWHHISKLYLTHYSKMPIELTLIRPNAIYLYLASQLFKLSVKMLQQILMTNYMQVSYLFYNSLNRLWILQLWVKPRAKSFKITWPVFCKLFLLKLEQKSIILQHLILSSW